MKRNNIFPILISTTLLMSMVACGPNPAGTTSPAGQSNTDKSKVNDLKVPDKSLQSNPSNTLANINMADYIVIEPLKDFKVQQFNEHDLHFDPNRKDGTATTLKNQNSFEQSNKIFDVKSWDKKPDTNERSLFGKKIEPTITSSDQTSEGASRYFRPEFDFQIQQTNAQKITPTYIPLKGGALAVKRTEFKAQILGQGKRKKSLDITKGKTFKKKLSALRKKFTKKWFKMRKPKVLHAPLPKKWVHRKL